jgi:excisionase family DNA binding protein
VIDLRDGSDADGGQLKGRARGRLGSEWRLEIEAGWSRDLEVVDGLVACEVQSTEEVVVAATRHSAVIEQVPLMDIEAVARRLGVPVRHVRRLVAERRIPFLKWSHLLRFDPAEIEAWLDQARRG